MWVLENAIKAVKQGNPDEALSLLSERLKKAKLQRRKAVMELSNDEDWTSSDEEAEERPQKKVQDSVLEKDVDVASGAYWEGLFSCEAGSFGGPMSAMELASEADTESLMTQLRRGGFLASNGSVLGEEVMCNMLKEMHILRESGWPAAFIWASKAPWEAVLALWGTAEKILGGDVVLEPSFTAYHLNGKAQSEGEKYVGVNFGKPHRDYTFSDSYDANGAPQIITMWVPCTDATTTNGCMYVVPKEFDSFFNRDDSYKHQQVIQGGSFQGHKCVNFPIEGDPSLFLS